eukprot:1241896-Pleurochrysis_carterae.AAC.1
MGYVSPKYHSIRGVEGSASGFQHPSVRVTTEHFSAGAVHDNVSQREESTKRQRLSEEIRHIFGAPHEGHGCFVGLDLLAHA